MANTGGGLVVVGLDDKGRHSNKSVRSILDLDPATIRRKYLWSVEQEIGPQPLSVSPIVDVDDGSPAH